jgi:hypothetical protein
MDLAASLTRRLTQVVTPRDGDAAKQLYFAILLVGFSALIAISHLDVVLAGPYLAALALVTAATVAAFVVPWAEPLVGRDDPAGRLRRDRSGP